MLTRAKLQIEPLQERPVDSEWPVTATRREHAGGRGSDRRSRMERCWRQESGLLGKRARRLFEPEVPKEGFWIQSTWAQLPSGATAVLLGAHQHFAVQLLLLLFEGIFYLGAFQSSVPATHWKKNESSSRTVLLRHFFEIMRRLLQVSSRINKRGWWLYLRLPNNRRLVAAELRDQTKLTKFYQHPSCGIGYHILLQAVCLTMQLTG